MVCLSLSLFDCFILFAQNFNLKLDLIQTCSADFLDNLTLIPIQIETSAFPLVPLFGYCNFNLRPQYVRLLMLDVIPTCIAEFHVDSINMPFEINAFLCH